MARKDFIISFYAGGTMMNKVLEGLARPYVLWQPGRPKPKSEKAMTGDWRGLVASYGRRIPAMFQAAGGKDDTIGRVAIVGFSEGVQGVSEILKGPDASKIDVVLPIDGIHEQYFGAAPVINPGVFEEYISFGMLAAAKPMSAQGSHVLAITHSSVRPPMISTTESARVIWDEVMKRSQGPFEDLSCEDCLAAKNVLDLEAVVFPCPAFPVGTKLSMAEITEAGYCNHRPAMPELKQPDLSLCYPRMADGWSIQRVANGLSTFGWVYDTKNRTRDPTGTLDHVFQGQVVGPYMVKEYVVDRWNPTCDTDVLRRRALQGDAGSASKCSFGMGTQFGEGDAPAPLPQVFTGGMGLPVIAKDCPEPPPGSVIVGRPGDPCWYTSGRIPVEPPPPPKPTDTSLALNLFAAAAGVGIGVAAYHYLRKR